MTAVVAWIAWALSALLAVGDVFAPHGIRLLGPSFLLAAAGGILHVRTMIHNMERREREAFNLGRESVRELRR